MELYKTVRSEAKTENIIERSRFITHVKPAETREDAEEFIAVIRKRYKDATHNVPAMVIGDKSQIQWASDDGEPQGTSGAPIVQMLVNEGITNVVIVVTRYFGGIKLGTGGLVRAYTGSAKSGIEAAGICSVHEMISLKAEMGYAFLSKLQSMASSGINGRDGGAGFVINNVEYSDKVTVNMMTVPEEKEQLYSLLNNITSGSAVIIEEKMNLEKL